MTNRGKLQICRSLHTQKFILTTCIQLFKNRNSSTNGDVVVEGHQFNGKQTSIWYITRKQPLESSALMQRDTPQTSSTQSNRLTPADWNVLASVCVYKFDGDYMQTFTNQCESEYSQTDLVFCLLGKQLVNTATSNQSPNVKKIEAITSFTSH